MQLPITKGNSLGNKNHAKDALLKYKPVQLSHDQKMTVIKKAAAMAARKQG